MAPAPIVIFDAWKFETFFESVPAGVEWSNVMFVAGAALPTDVELLAAQANLNGTISSHIMPLLNTHTVFVESILSDVNEADGPQTTLVDGTIGSVTGTPCQFDQCMVVTWETALRGRANRGRTYFRGLSVSDYVGSEGERQWGTSTIANFEAAGVTLIANFVADTSALVVAHRALHTCTIVTNANARAGIFSQRRTGQPSG